MSGGRGFRKFGNVKVKADGYTFDSKAEEKRYQELKLLKATGLICNLIVHPRYPIKINGMKVCTYVGDFEYQDQKLVRHVEDVKGVETREFKTKAKLMKAVHQITVEIIRA